MAEENRAISYLQIIPVFCAVFLSVLDYAIANIALPQISAELAIPASLSVWVVNAYQLSNAMLLLPVARLSDRLGAKRLCVAGLLIIIAGSLLCAMAHTFPVLVAGRLIQGVGGSCIMSVSSALVRQIYPHARLGQGLAINALVIAFGFAVSPGVSSAILYLANWRWLFLFNIPYALLLLFPLFRYVPLRIVSRARVDGLPLVLTACCLGAPLLSFDMLAHGGHAALAGLAAVVMGACATVLIRRERGSEAPVLPVDLLCSRDFLAAFMVCFIGYITANFFMVSIPFTLTTYFHRTVIHSGLLITFWPLGMVMGGPLVARAADRVQAGLLSSFGLALVGAGFLCLYFLPCNTADPALCALFLMAGVGFSFFVSPNNKAMMVAAPLHRSASASAMISVGRIMGQSVGAACVAYVMQAYATERGGHLCLVFGVLSAWLGVLVSVSRLRRP
ncbi:MFS transporter [Komagataeibacter sucrofermentans]|nr:MFS transporter [Komagataeibacter sucrofermentans]GBQ47355.1 transporter [Komagataeibacter sucrofermentans DSM 15973]